jgi:hypothetical protein
MENIAMSDFTTVYPETIALDPGKRVNYIHGLVLGVDEFKQEECYLLEKERLHNRALHGYGTVCGLRVSQEEDDAGLEILVEPGIAISPSGQVIQVPRTQCAIVDEWLASHGEEIAEMLGSPAAGSLSLYLMLCYRECKTDLVPIPTGPCQSLEETTAPSRIADDFSLSFELQAPPDEHFESAMQEFSDLLLDIPVEVDGAMTLEDIQALVRTLIPEGSPGSPPSGPVPSSPPLSSPPLADAIAPENVHEFYHAAFLVWVTEVKPCLLTDTSECVPSDPYQNCVFLAQLNLDVETSDGITRLDPGVDVEIDEQLRQFLINSQGLQNYLSPLSYWVKSLANISLPDIIALPLIDGEDDVVTLSGDQTITGSKSFNAPILLGSEGRVVKNIVLPAHHAHPGRRGAARSLFTDSLPSMHLLTTGTNAFNGVAFFDIPIPDDIVHNRGFQFRLVWGFQGAPQPGGTRFNWRVGAQFFQANETITASPFQFVTVPVSETTTQRNAVLVTSFGNFASTIALTRNDRYGAMQVSLDDPGGSIPQVFLLQVELQYTADRLGGRIQP